MDSKNAAPVSVSNTAYDGIRLEVLRNLLEGIGDGMALTVVRASRSSIVRASLDFSTGVLSANGDLIGQGLCLPIHLHPRKFHYIGRSVLSLGDKANFGPLGIHI